MNQKRELFYIPDEKENIETQVPKTGIKQIDEFLFYLLTGNGNAKRMRSESTVKTYRSVLLDYEKFLREVRNEDVESFNFDQYKLRFEDTVAYFKYIQKDRIDKKTEKVIKANSKRTQLKKYMVLKVFFEEFLGDKELLAGVPEPSFEEDATVKSITKEELSKLLKAAESASYKEVNEYKNGRFLRDENGDKKTKTIKDHRNAAIMYLFANTGIRCFELVNANVGDIVIGERKSSITVIGKRDKQRKIPIKNLETKLCFKAYFQQRFGVENWYDLDAKKKREFAQEPLFLSQRKTRITERQVARVVEQLGEKIGFHKKDENALHPHMLRHTYATLLVRTGRITLPVLQKLMGHESLETTQNYLNMSESEVEEALEEAFDLL